MSKMICWSLTSNTMSNILLFRLHSHPMHGTHIEICYISHRRQLSHTPHFLMAHLQQRHNYRYNLPFCIVHILRLFTYKGYLHKEGSSKHKQSTTKGKQSCVSFISWYALYLNIYSPKKEKSNHFIVEWRFP